MKNKFFIAALTFCTFIAIGQNKSYKYRITIGSYIQHYNGNLGNSFFQFNTTCFAGGSATFGMYLNKSFDLNISASIGDFGYCQTDADKSRIVSISQRCPGCTDRLGMGELRSRMTSGNILVKYKFCNNYLLSADNKFSPYIYAGFGINHLADNMKRNCVNAGNHFTINAGAGIKYNFNKRLNIGYNLGVGCFTGKKVYYTNAMANETTDKDADDIKMEKRKDLYMQNTLTIGINF